MARILIGTSGWHYESWRGPFFPQGLPLKAQLQFYAGQFPTAELNGVFYRTPTPKAVKGWRDQSGNDFVFAWKASKFITHWKRLSDNSINSLELLENRLSFLGTKVGPILFQLPPNFRADADRLGKFFKMLRKKRRYSFEFRDPSWYTPQILRMLAEQNISLCQTTTTRPHPGSERLTLSTSEVTVQVAVTGGTIRQMSSRNGPSEFVHGRNTATMSTSILTMIKNPLRRLTP
jgi:uncharacterized protein YecE (DUF72 family)